LLRNVWTPWTRWFKAAGLDWPEPTGGMLFDDSQLLLRAAMQDQGMILARHWFAIDDVRAGRLIAPFDLSVGTEHAYWVVWPMGRRESPAARLFREWLMAAAEKETSPIHAV
jgi:LysR family glycine cleavage system transcriptional activator